MYIEPIARIEENIRKVREENIKAEAQVARAIDTHINVTTKRKEQREGVIADMCNEEKMDRILTKIDDVGKNIRIIRICLAGLTLVTGISVTALIAKMVISFK